MTPQRTRAAGRLELLVPGMTGPLPAPPETRLQTPVLDLVLGRGERVPRPGGGLESALLARFGAAASAPYTAAVDDSAYDKARFRMRADPVHLRADRDALRLYDARHLGISRAEADGLVAELNRHFADDGLRWYAPVAARWYLEADPPPALVCVPLQQVIGCTIDGHLPQGPDARRWASLMNEAQMLLFQAEVNRVREADGRPAANGVWIWGGGNWRPLTVQGFDRVVADDPLACGLASAADIARVALPSRFEPAPGGALAVWTPLFDAVLDADEAAWAGSAQALDRWLAPALDALRAGRLSEILIDGCDGEGRLLTRGCLRRFWRRPRSIAASVRQPRSG
jgi:hypothetical protein